MQAITNRRNLLHILTALLAVVLIAFAFYVLHRFTENVSLQQVMDDIRDTPTRSIILAFLTMMTSFTAIACYEMLAVRLVAPGRIRLRTAAWAGVAGFALSDAIGFHVLTGGALRYRIYSRGGIEFSSIGQIIFLSWMCLWLGVGSLIGCALAFQPEGVHQLVPIPVFVLRAIGVFILIVFLAYFVWIATGSRRIAFRGMQVKLPGLRVGLMQLCAGFFDVGASAATLYVLLPADIAGSPGSFFIVYISAVILGTASHSPGGLGVFDATVIAGLGAGGRPDVLGALVLYRVIYYLVPVIPVVIVMLATELFHGGRAIKGGLGEIGKVTQPLLPPLAAGLTFAAGFALMLSGSIPVDWSGHEWLKSNLSLAVFESSHMLASLVGLALIIISHALLRRRRSGYYAVLGLLLAGALFALVKGMNLYLAAGLVVTFLVLLPFRQAFYRRSGESVFAVTPFWLMLMLVTLASAVWLGFFAHRNADFAGDLWWQFGWNTGASRFLRSAFVMVVAVFALGLFMLLNRRRVAVGAGEAIPESVRRLAAQSPKAETTIALLGDKSFLISPQENAFLMYGASGRTLVAKGDPVGDRSEGENLAWRFRELADRDGYRPAFYAVGTGYLPLYVDMGLSVLKIGEVARVDLTGFTLEGHGKKDLRHAQRRAEKEGLSFEIVPSSDVLPIMPSLRRISDAWLASKSGSEKRFALGNFNEPYLLNFDMAVIRRGDETVAFANILRGSGREEMAIDLMRFVPGASNVVMDFLFAELLLYAQSEQYHWFNLGAAPLAGLADHPLATTWNRIGTQIYKRGEDFYHFEGLRSFKQKFDPVWTPNYLACSGGFAAPQALLDITALISGGRLSVLRK